MFQRKTTNIELGGHIQINSPVKPQVPMLRQLSPNSRISQLQKTETVCSKEMISSSHKLPLKLSPSKRKMLPHQSSRNGSFVQNQQSFIELQNSGISIIHRAADRKIPFIDRSNIQSPNNQSRQFVKVNFVQNTPDGSRQSSIHLRQFKPSPTKVVITPKKIQVQSKDVIELSRKLRILQNRIGQLHKEKHDLVGQLNQQNRKIYHQNTTLKLKITELNKALERRKEEQKLWANMEKQQESKNQYFNEDNLIQIQTLKKQICELQQLLQAEGQNNSSLIQKCGQLEANIAQKHKMNQSLKTQLAQIKQSYKSKETNFYNLQKQHSNILKQNEIYIKQKAVFEQDIETIRGVMTQNSERNNLIIQQYQSKLEEYRLAYLQNQEVINQLTLTVTELQNSKEEIVINYQIREEPESKQNCDDDGHEEAERECQIFQNNLVGTLQERDRLIQQLQIKISNLEEANQAKCKQYQSLLIQGDQKTQKLSDISIILEKYNDKIQLMEARYQQLSIKYQSQKQRLSKTQSSFSQSGKCKRCDQLMKTIFRLNSHLNAKKNQ